MLPDSSTVILNARSEIRYLTDWDQDAPREVWLDGEAFFSVTHTAGQQKFIVHTNDHLNVEVLGTQFNVSQRANRTRVVLSAGEIRLQIRNEGNNQAVKHIKMKPGDLVEFRKATQEPIKKTVNPQVYSAWKNNRLFFDNTTLPELKTLLEERYDLKVVVADTLLPDIRFNGDFPSDNLQLLLKALAATYNLEVRARPHEIYLETGNNRN
jgi:ferric-dicitrate binding protein FerR (iron transport regulator)